MEKDHRSLRNEGTHLPDDHVDRDNGLVRTDRKSVLGVRGGVRGTRSGITWTTCGKR